ARDFGEPGEDFAIFVGGGGTVEVEGIGDDAGHHNPGGLRGRGDAFAAEEVGDDGAGGADGIVDKKDRLLGVEISEAVVVDDLDNVYLGGAGDGLAEFVMIDEDEVDGGRFEEVGFGEDSEQTAVFAENHEG